MTDVMTRERDALELVALGWHVIVVRPEDRKPFAGSRGWRDHTTDPEVVEKWFSAQPDAVVAVVPGLSGKTVIDFDAHEGKSNGFESAARENLPTEAEVSGLSFSGTGKHLWFDGATDRWLGRYPGIDRLSGPSYVVINYDLPAPEDVIEPLPEVFAGSRPDIANTANPYEGDLSEWLQAHDGEPTYQRMSMIQSVLSEPFTGHQRMIEIQTALVSSGEPGVTAALSVLRDHWISSTHSTDDDPAAEWDAALAGAIRNYGTPIVIPAFLDADQLQHHIDREQWTIARSDASLEEVVQAAKNAGANDLIAASLAWSSRAGLKIADQQRARETVWDLAVSTQAAVAKASEAFGPLVPLLSKAERKKLADPRMRDWFGENYVQWALDRTRPESSAYHRNNRWTILQLAFMPHSVILPKSGVPMRLNLFMAMLGATTSGKSQARDLMKLVISEMHWLEGCWFSDTTREALIKHMVERDGEPTLFLRDEAHEFIKSTKTEAPFKNLPGYLTDMYDGDAGGLLRSHEKDLNGKTATALFSINFTGTFEGFADAIEAADWQSGWMNRFVFAIGEQPREPTLDDFNMGSFNSSLRPEQRHDMEKAWASQFNAGIAVLDSALNKAMRIDDDVLSRHAEMGFALRKFADKSHFAARLKPTFIRLGNSVMKAASLIALSEAHLHASDPENARRVTMRHFLLALEQAEEWAENIVRMVAATDETPARREMKKFLALIHAQGSQMPRRQLFDISNKDKRMFNVMIENMVELGWVEEFEAPGGTPWVKAIEGSK